MRLLLDTHVLLWALLDPGHLRPEAARAIEAADNEVLVSAVSAWEIAIKQSLGKLVLPGPAERWLPAACSATGLAWLPVDENAALRVRGLAWHHRDPFDRLLVAQAGRELTVVTRDPKFAPYGVDVLPA
ncbi:MAG: type II toxin-antitoxin system VapC family toxin [Deltaproteobacteria bacterium]|nr:type II toxin-antitoxin system VapC family toxin [Deltaproteobacteria bacterium]